MTIYVDGSGSMAGYASSPDDRTFVDIVDSLPTIAGSEAVATHYVRFGIHAHDLSPTRRQDLLRPAFYACNRTDPECDNQESRIDSRFQEIASAGPKSFSVIVTDLWLKDKEQLTGDSVALTQPLIAILRDGRAIMVYGFEAGYRGTVPDLPSGARNVKATSRPLYVIAIGPLEAVEAFHTRMARFLPAPLAADVQGSGGRGHARFSLFTIDPVPSRSRPAVTFSPTYDGAVKRGSVFQHARELKIDQFIIDARAASTKKGQAGPAWSGPELGAIHPGTVWSGPIEPVLHVWRLIHDGKRCEAGDWNEVREIPPGLGWREGADAQGRRSFVLDATAFAQKLGRGTYLVAGAARRSSLDIPNPASAWMREWGFMSGDEARALAARPGYVPTLNLPDLARLMEGALAEAAERQNQETGAVLGGFAFAVKVQ